MMLRAEFPVQRNRTLNSRVGHRFKRSSRCASRCLDVALSRARLADCGRALFRIAPATVFHQVGNQIVHRLVVRAVNDRAAVAPAGHQACVSSGDSDGTRAWATERRAARRFPRPPTRPARSAPASGTRRASIPAPTRRAPPVPWPFSYFYNYRIFRIIVKAIADPVRPGPVFLRQERRAAPRIPIRRSLAYDFSESRRYAGKDEYSFMSAHEFRTR